MQRFVVYKFGTTAAIAAFFAAIAFAQQADEAPADKDEVIDEITVVATKRGDKKRIDAIYMDPTRARVLRDLSKLKIDEEEYEWRTATIVESPSRIKWGYDPRDDYEMRNRMSQQNLDWNQTRPATLFSVGF